MTMSLDGQIVSVRAQSPAGSPDEHWAFCIDCRKIKQVCCDRYFFARDGVFYHDASRCNECCAHEKHKEIDNG